MGAKLDDGVVDEMLKEIDSDNDGIVDILEWAKICFNIKDK